MADILFPVPDSWAESAWIDNESYRRMYEHSDFGSRELLGRTG